jgi:succinate dehydrogenase / fumarate reductase membrane anchor subunit
MSMRTPLGRVTHYGSAHEGTAHFWRQRVTGAANAVLAVALVVVLFATVGRPYAQVVPVLGSPLVAAALALAIVSATVHMRIGMQTIIEDYIHSEALKVMLLVANTFFAFAVAAVGLIAVARLALGA